MTSSGKHAKASSQVRTGKHGVVVQPRYSIWHICLIVLLAAALALIPITIAWSHISLDSQAFADSTRTAFSELSDATAQAAPDGMPEQTADYTSHVGSKMQNSIMSGGCELVSLGIVLESMGIDADLDGIVANHLDINGHYANGYSGDPYSQGAGYPQGIAAAANGYLESNGMSARAHDLTGSSFQELEAIVAQGYPVLVWTTMGFADPQFTNTFDQGLEWYSNEHCVVLYGFDGDNALISDPLDGLVLRDSARFADLYEQCGSMAMAIY